MKALLVSIILCCISVMAVNAQDELLYEKASQLKLIYGKWQKDPNKQKYEPAFFEEFPDDYKTFAAIYGYEDTNVGKHGILYHYSYDHIAKFLGTMTSVNDTMYYNKIIAISVDAHWQADAESFFQDVVGSTQPTIWHWYIIYCLNILKRRYYSSGSFTLMGRILLKR